MSGFETARGRCRVEDGTIRIRTGMITAIRRMMTRSTLRFFAILGVLIVGSTLYWWLTSDVVGISILALGLILALMLLAKLQFRFTRLSNASEIPVPSVKKVVYVDGKALSTPRYLVYFETGDAVSVRVLSMGALGTTIGDIEGAKSAFERAGLEVDNSMLNDP